MFTRAAFDEQHLPPLATHLQNLQSMQERLLSVQASLPQHGRAFFLPGAEALVEALTLRETNLDSEQHRCPVRSLP